MASDATLVRYEVAERIATLTLDDPPANAYTHEMMLQLDAAVLRARFDSEVDVIVLTGAGDKFFCAGANISMLREADPEWKYWFCLHANETLLRLEHTPKLVIAAIGGHCVGGGFEVAMACDLRIARSGGGLVGLPEVALGVLPGTGGTQRLTGLVGKSRAIELMASGEKMPFERAVELGLLTRTLEAEAGEPFQAAVREHAKKFTCPTAAAGAVGRIKRACQSGAELPLEQGLALERELQAQLFAGDDAREGLQAFLDKRDPRFTGR